MVVTLSNSCKKNLKEETPAVKTTTEIGAQIWTTSNYTINNVELFSYDEAKKATPPTSYRLPTKEDWEKLFRYLGYTPNTYSSTAYNSGSVIITEKFLEGDYNIVKGLLSTEIWGYNNGNQIKGINTIGFNSLLNKSTYFMSDPNFGYVELFGDGFYSGYFSKDPRPYLPAASYPAKYSIRFVKDK